MHTLSAETICEYRVKFGQLRFSLSGDNMAHLCAFVPA